MPIKITTWNLEHAQRLVGPDPAPHVVERRRRVRDTLRAIDPDILCIQEGPEGEQAVSDFCDQVLNNDWVPVFLHQGDDYDTKGTQWIWFLVKPALQGRCQLQAPAVWQSFTGSRTWPVNYWGNQKSSRHSHYRHPQVLLFDLGTDQALELIGVHLKSKINQKPIERDADGNLTGEYLTIALEARVKLATEARNVRQYIDTKFDQLAHPGILVMGDCNDGPGHDLFENQYLFFDLIGNLQGEVLLAERFFNHALFDYPQNLRWTAKYRDELLGISASLNPLLLDHLLISQPLCRGQLPLVVNAGAGKVEHEAYERFNAGSNNKTKTSDHRPVSCRLDDD